MKKALIAGLLVVILVAGWVVVAVPFDGAEEAARCGAIKADAPVKASVEITIQAPPDKVWGLLTDVQGWPRWYAAITDTAVAGPVQTGTEFSWKMGGNSIHSKFGLVTPTAVLAWSGKALGAKAVHVWKLQPLAENRTLVHVDESMDGVLLQAFYSSQKLKEGDQAWLDALKVAAER